MKSQARASLDGKCIEPIKIVEYETNESVLQNMFPFGLSLKKFCQLQFASKFNFFFLQVTITLKNFIGYIQLYYIKDNNVTRKYKMLPFEENIFIFMTSNCKMNKSN